MPGYRKHLFGGLCVVVAVLVVAFTQIDIHSLPPTRYVVFLGIVLGLGALASILPDVDVHSSKARRGLGKIGFLGALGVTGIVLARYPDIIIEPLSSRLPSIAGNPVFIGVGILALVALGASAVGDTFDSVTTHRGWFHSPVFILLLGVVGVGSLYGAGIRNPRLLGLGAIVVVGAGAAHIFMDTLA